MERLQNAINSSLSRVLDEIHEMRMNQKTETLERYKNISTLPIAVNIQYDLLTSNCDQAATNASQCSGNLCMFEFLHAKPKDVLVNILKHIVKSSVVDFTKLSTAKEDIKNMKDIVKALETDIISKNTSKIQEWSKSYEKFYKDVVNLHKTGVNPFSYIRKLFSRFFFGLAGETLPESMSFRRSLEKFANRGNDLKNSISTVLYLVELLENIRAASKKNDAYATYETRETKDGNITSLRECIIGRLLAVFDQITPAKINKPNKDPVIDDHYFRKVANVEAYLAYDKQTMNLIVDFIIYKAIIACNEEINEIVQKIVTFKKYFENLKEMMATIEGADLTEMKSGEDMKLVDEMEKKMDYFLKMYNDCKNEIHMKGDLTVALNLKSNIFDPAKNTSLQQLAVAHIGKITNCLTNTYKHREEFNIYSKGGQNPVVLNGAKLIKDKKYLLVVINLTTNTLIRENSVFGFVDIRTRVFFKVSLNHQIEKMSPTLESSTRVFMKDEMVDIAMITPENEAEFKASLIDSTALVLNNHLLPQLYSMQCSQFDTDNWTHDTKFVENTCFINNLCDTFISGIPGILKGACDEKKRPQWDETKYTSIMPHYEAPWATIQNTRRDSKIELADAIKEGIEKAEAADKSVVSVLFFFYKPIVKKIEELAEAIKKLLLEGEKYKIISAEYRACKVSFDLLSVEIERLKEEMKQADKKLKDINPRLAAVENELDGIEMVIKKGSGDLSGQMVKKKALDEERNNLLREKQPAQEMWNQASEKEKTLKVNYKEIEERYKKLKGDLEESRKACDELEAVVKEKREKVKDYEKTAFFKAVSEFKNESPFKRDEFNNGKNHSEDKQETTGGKAANVENVSVENANVEDADDDDSAVEAEYQVEVESPDTENEEGLEPNKKTGEQKDKKKKSAEPTKDKKASRKNKKKSAKKAKKNSNKKSKHSRKDEFLEKHKKKIVISGIAFISTVALLFIFILF